MRVALAVLALVVAVPGTPAHAAQVLQPGAYVQSSIDGCTLNFVFDGTGSRAGTVYFGIAAHCVNGAGDIVRDADNVAFGVVAWAGSTASAATDVALIAVDDEDESRVVAAVKGHPAYPTGTTTTVMTATGDRLQLSGYGIGFDGFTLTQESRFGVLVRDTAATWEAVAPVSIGDSGGPVVHVPTGTALGVVSRTCNGQPCNSHGATVVGLVSAAGLAGYTVALRHV